MLSPKLETERLILRRYKLEDIDFEYKIITDKRLTKYISFPRKSFDEELECLKSWINDADSSKYEKWVITLKSSGTPIGIFLQIQFQKKIIIVMLVMLLVTIIGV